MAAAVSCKAPAVLEYPGMTVHALEDKPAPVGEGGILPLEAGLVMSCLGASCRVVAEASAGWELLEYE